MSDMQESFRTLVLTRRTSDDEPRIWLMVNRRLREEGKEDPLISLFRSNYSANFVTIFVNSVLSFYEHRHHQHKDLRTREITP